MGTGKLPMQIETQGFDSRKITCTRNHGGVYVQTSQESTYRACLREGHQKENTIYYHVYI